MNEYQQYAAQVAKRNGVPRNLFFSLVQAESGWNANARSPVGARGLTQLMPGTARGLGVDPDDWRQNLDGGARYLKQQIDRFGGDYRKAVAAYNAGPGAVQKYGGIPPYKETQAYVKRVLAGMGNTQAPTGSPGAMFTTPAPEAPAQTGGGESTAFAQNLINRNAKMFKLPTITLPATAPSNVSFKIQPDNGVDYQQIPARGDIGSAITQAAKQFLGVKYVWGGTTPKGFDCSGLIKYVFNKFGITTPRVSQDQFKGGMNVKQGQSRAGDLIFFRHADGQVGHVGIMLGNGQFLHAPRTGDVVKISNLKGYGLPVAGIRRYAK